MRALLLSASWLRTLCEVALLFACLVALSSLIYQGQVEQWWEPTIMFLVNPLCALYYSLRLRIPTGSWLRQLLLESASILLFSLLTATVIYPSWLTLLEHNPRYNSYLLTFLFFFLFLFPYMFFRGMVRLIRWWRDRSQRTLLWSLVNSHVIVVVVLQLLLIVPLSIFTLRNQILAANPPDALFAQVLYRLQQLLPVIGIVILLAVAILIGFLPFAFIVSYLFARRIRRRLDALLTAAHAMRDGDYSVRIPVTGHDEISTLQTDFNRMGSQLEQQFHALQSERETVSRLLSTRREMMANVSHELRTPIAVLRAQIEAAQRQNTMIDPELLHRDVLHLQRLVDDLVALAQTETEQLSLRLEPTSVNQALTRIVESLTPLAWRQQKVEIVSELAPDAPLLLIDQTRFEQIILNLLHNALRYTGPGGVILLRSDAQGQIEIRDTGSGIAPDDLPHIWERYYRDPEQGGSGLGLTLVHSLVSAMGGTIAVESALGEGTSFTITLPRA
jgi:signal transduction histidine kinase